MESSSQLFQNMGPSESGHVGLFLAIPWASWQLPQPISLSLLSGYPDHMVFAEFRRRFDVLAPHLTKKHGRNYIVVDEKRVHTLCQGHCYGLGSPKPSLALTPLALHRQWRSSWSHWTWRRAATTWA